MSAFFCKLAPSKEPSNENKKNKIPYRVRLSRTEPNGLRRQLLVRQSHRPVCPGGRRLRVCELRQEHERERLCQRPSAQIQRRHGPLGPSDGLHGWDGSVRTGERAGPARGHAVLLPAQHRSRQVHCRQRHGVRLCRHGIRCHEFRNSETHAGTRCVPQRDRVGPAAGTLRKRRGPLSDT